MIFLLLFFVELILLFILSRSLSRSLSLLLYKAIRSEKWAVWLLALLFLPGTIIHELAHFLTAAILMVHVGEIEFMPKVRENTVKLGSVAIGHTDILRRATIGFAPVLVGVACLSATFFYFSSFPLSPWFLNLLLAFVIIFEVGNTMFSSSRDVEGTWQAGLFLAFVGLLLYALKIPIPQSFISWVWSTQHQEFVRMLSLYMLIPLAIDGLIILGARRLHSRR